MSEAKSSRVCVCGACMEGHLPARDVPYGDGPYADGHAPMLDYAVITREVVDDPEDIFLQRVRPSA